ncbi:SdpI family protein [Corynebacterium afermentans]|uniref:SdpI family protein n=1 Tax=Corynebacterium afermentans TaxID=38286 RepID=UPI0025730D3D|nr:SdpI family protein [Corynebacterium afermentans]MCG7291329.1 SdpI family protein [Corynebacterium afermentans]
MGSALAISALALLFFGVNSLILCRKTVNGTNSRNDGFGIRTQATRTSDAAWNAGHRAAVPLLRAFGILDILFALLLVVIGLLAPDIGARLGITIRLIAYAVAATGFFIAVKKADAAARVVNGQ